MPRGCLESVLKALKAERFNPVLTDRHYAGVPFDATFRGELRPGQKLAVSELRKSDTGILAAGTAFGKTVVAASLIAERKVNTLVPVNRRQLQMQLVAQLSSFLGIPERDIGRIGAGTGRWTGKIDVAILQSVSRKGAVDPRVKEYGQIVIDECRSALARDVCRQRPPPLPRRTRRGTGRPLRPRDAPGQSRPAWCRTRRRGAGRARVPLRAP